MIMRYELLHHLYEIIVDIVTYRNKFAEIEILLLHSKAQSQSMNPEILTSDLIFILLASQQAMISVMFNL